MSVNETDIVSQTTVLPLLTTIGRTAVAIGGPWCRGELCSNLAVESQMIGVCEALSLGESTGVDSTALKNDMSTSMGNSWSVSMANPHPTAEKANLACQVFLSHHH